MPGRMVAKVGRIGLIGVVERGGGAAGEERNFEDSAGSLRVVGEGGDEDSIVEVGAKKRGVSQDLMATT